ncbi:MAG TPA: PAS domain S-box protein [Candidatus Dormibacteraeota bacterium]|nr:PAS domain S-box protein [Candidatus Dormibacteraeota bacterium]
MDKTPSETDQQVPRLYDSEAFRDNRIGVVVWHLDDSTDLRSFRIVDANPIAAKLMGTTIEDLRGKTLCAFPKFLESDIAKQCVDVLRSGKLLDFGDVPYAGDEHIEEGIYSIRIFPILGDCVGVSFENVTDQRMAERAARESEERFRLLVEGVREYSILHLDPNGIIVGWNTGAERLKGYRGDEIIGKHFSVFYPPEEVQLGKPEQNLRHAAEMGQSEVEGWRIRKDGSRFWGNVVITALRDSHGHLRGFAKLTRDMTERREKEEQLRRANQQLELRVRQRTADLVRVNLELRTEIAEREKAEEQLRHTLEQLRALAARLQFVREEERMRMAREIHDELGQACTALKMDIALLARKGKTQLQIRSKADSAMRLIDNLIQSMRRMASELRPSTLDDLGLVAALEWQAQEYETHTEIQCHVELPTNPLVLDSNRSTAIFRIFQEALTNIARHAKATRVDASLKTVNQKLVLQVRDNGIGYDPKQLKIGRSLGLVGMRERALLLEGEFTIEGIPGKGTTITVRIPVPSSAPSGVETK